MECHALLQGLFLIQGLNQRLLAPGARQGRGEPRRRRAGVGSWRGYAGSVPLTWTSFSKVYKSPQVLAQGVNGAFWYVCSHL